MNRNSLAAILICASIQCMLAQSGEWRETEALLIKIPDEPNIAYTPRVSPTGRVAALVCTADGKSSIVVNGKEGERFDEVYIVQFNPVAAVVNYIARLGKKMVFVCGEKKGPEFDDIPYFRCVPGGEAAGTGIMGRMFVPNQIPDGEKYAYWGVKDNKWTFVFGEKTWEGFATSDHREADGGANIQLSPDGKHVAFEARSPDQKWSVVSDQFTSSTADAANLYGMTNGGQPVYCLYESDAWTLFVGATKIGKHAQIGAVAFTPDGSRLVYPATTQRNGETGVFDNGKQVAAHLLSGPIVLSPDGKSYAYFAGGEGKTTLVLNGKEAAKSYEYCFAQPLFSPDSAHIVYPARKSAKKWVMVLDGVESEEFDMTNYPVFSPDSKTLGFVGSSFADVNHDVNFMVLGGKKEANYAAVGNLVFSADSRHYAYAATLADAKGYSVVLDGKPSISTAGNRSLLTFSANGTLVYQGTATTVVVGEKIMSKEDLILTPPVFNAARTKIGYAAQKGNDVWWRVVEE